MDVLERLNSTRKPPRKVTLTVDHRALSWAAITLTIALAACALGLKLGYRYAKLDVEAVLSDPTTSHVIPSWRRWANSDVQHHWPNDMTNFFKVFEVYIPGNSGISTNTLWEVYQNKISDYLQGARVLTDGPAPEAVAVDPPAKAHKRRRRD